jgi:CHAT domain-containing protein
MGAVDLFVLSACETALDSDNKNGVEIEGLANSLQENGAKSVMATLWKVEDQSTASFMQNFYQAHENESVTKARALQSVQMKFINGEIGTDSAATDDRGSFAVDGGQTNPLTKDYTHPYFWAPFVLMGNFL